MDFKDNVAEWLRRWPAKSIPFGCVSSNLIVVEFFYLFFIESFYIIYHFSKDRNNPLKHNKIIHSKLRIF